MSEDYGPFGDETAFLKVFMADRDLPCPVCDYNLRAITSANCPECGATLQLRLRSADLRFGPWLVAVLAMAIPLVVVAVLVVLVSISSVIDSMVYGTGEAALVAHLEVAVPMLGMTAFYAFGLRRVIRNRRKFWAKPRSKQRRSAVNHILVTPGLIGLFVILMFLLSFIGYVMSLWY